MRTVTSTIFFSIAQPQNKKTMPEGMVKGFDPEEETGVRSNRREMVARMSGGLLLVAELISEQMRISQAQVHQARVGDAVVAPLRYCLAGHIEQLGNGSVAA
jgi:hypothetical protein